MEKNENNFGDKLKKLQEDSEKKIDEMLDGMVNEYEPDIREIYVLDINEERKRLSDINEAEKAYAHGFGRGEGAVYGTLLGSALTVATFGLYKLGKFVVRKIRDRKRLKDTMES